MAADAQQLIELAEKATGPDRELDCLIARATGKVDHRTITNGFGFGYVDRGQWACSDVPRYTASLDAAMTLVPEGYGATLDRFAADREMCSAQVWFEDRDVPARGAAKTLALALTAAALRAHAALLQGNQNG